VPSEESTGVVWPSAMIANLPTAAARRFASLEILPNGCRWVSCTVYKWANGRCWALCRLEILPNEACEAFCKTYKTVSSLR
jgi:hypothetical protein